MKIIIGQLYLLNGFSLGLSKLHEHPLPDEDALLDGCKMHGNLASKELVARSNQPQPLL